MGSVPAGGSEGGNPYLICTEDRFLSGDVQRAVFTVLFNIAVLIELQFSVGAPFHSPTEAFWGDRACSRYWPVLLLWFLSSFIVTGNRASQTK